MATLSPILPFIDDETHMSWAARQAAFHTNGRVRSFLTDLGISLADLARGEEGAVLRLCERTGHDPAPVLHNTISPIGNRRFRLRGHEFAAEFTTGPVTRICPFCLEDDRSEQRLPGVALCHRLIWRLAPIRTCPIHSTALRDIRLGTSDDNAHELQAMTEMIETELQAAVRTREVSPLQTYTIGRLNSETGPQWLDGQHIDQAVRATEMLGALDVFGPNMKASEMTEEMWDRAGRAGWHITSRGAPTVREFLLECAKASKGSKSVTRTSFGMLFAWLSASRLSKDPGPILELLRDVIIETTPISRGRMLLGMPVTSPQLCSVASIAKAEQMDARTLRNVLKVAGLLSEEEVEQKSNRLVVDYNRARDLIDIVKHAIPVTQLPDILGASRPMVDSLIRIGKLHRVQKHRALGSKLSRAIDGRSAEQILLFLRRFPNIDQAPKGFVHLSKSAEITRVELSLIFELLFLGHLKRVYRVTGAYRLAAVVVDPREIKALCASLPSDVSFLAI